MSDIPTDPTAGRVTADQRVPDLPCQKCGDTEVRIRYCDGCRLKLYSDGCHGLPEHFHRQCLRCGYGWCTDDVPDARLLCSDAKWATR